MNQYTNVRRKIKDSTALIDDNKRTSPSPPWKIHSQIMQIFSTQF